MPRHIKSALDADYSYDYASDTLRRNRPGLRRVQTVLVIVLLAVIFVGAGASYYSYRCLCDQARRIQELEQAAIKSMTTGASGTPSDYLTALKNNLSAAQSSTAQAKAITHSGLWDIYTHVHGYSTDAKTLRSMTDIMDSITTDVLPQYTTALDGVSGASLYNADGSLNVTPITDAVTRIASMNDGLKQQIDSMDALADPRDQTLYDAYENVVDSSSSVLVQMQSLSGLYEFLPNLLGTNGPRTYIVLGEETGMGLAAGGYIESVGWMTAQNGTFNVNDFYSSDLWAQNAGVADVTGDQNNLFNVISGISYGSTFSSITANPNFPEVAQQANDFWSATDFAGHGTDADGVILFDPWALQQLVAVSGDVTLNGGLKLTADDTAQFLAHDIYDSVDADSFAKYYTEIVDNIVNEAFTNMTMDKLLKLSDALVQCAEGRHAYVWSFHSEDQATLRATKLAGEFSTDAKNPVVGVYNQQKHTSAMDWYLKRVSTVTKTADQAYHVRFELNNTLGSAVDMPSAIVGEANSEAQVGHQLQRVYVYTPAGSTISNFSVQSGAQVQTVPLGSTTVYTFQTDIGMAANDVIEFDVACSQGAANLLLDQSPGSSDDLGVTYDYGL